MKTGIRVAALAVGFAVASASATDVFLSGESSYGEPGGDAALINLNVVNDDVDLVRWIWDDDSSWFDLYRSNDTHVAHHGGARYGGFPIGGEQRFEFVGGRRYVVFVDGALLDGIGGTGRSAGFGSGSGADVLGRSYVRSYGYGKNGGRAQPAAGFFGGGGGGSTGLTADVMEEIFRSSPEGAATDAIGALLSGAVGGGGGNGDDGGRGGDGGPVVSDVISEIVAGNPAPGGSAPATGGQSSTSVVPVPPALPLLVTALAGLAFLRRRRAG